MKVTVLDIIKKLLGTDDNSKLQRRATQNWRLLREFPWLWAIQSSWHLVETKIQVTKEDLSDFFSQKIVNGTKSHSDSIGEVWVYCIRQSNGRPVERVSPVFQDGRIGSGTLCRIPDARWHYLLMQFCDQNPDDTILNITVVQPYCDTITVYRPRLSTGFNSEIRYFGVGEM
jgi:hypothetical protein